MLQSSNQSATQTVLMLLFQGHVHMNARYATSTARKQLESRHESNRGLNWEVQSKQCSIEWSVGKRMSTLGSNLEGDWKMDSLNPLTNTYFGSICNGYTEHAQFRWFIKGYNNCVESIYTSSDQASCKFNQRKATNQIKIAYHQRIIKNIMQVKTIFVKEIARREIIFIRRWSNENCAESQWIVFTVHISLAILLP